MESGDAFKIAGVGPAFGVGVKVDELVKSRSCDRFVKSPRLGLAGRQSAPGNNPCTAWQRNCIIPAVNSQTVGSAVGRTSGGMAGNKWPAFQPMIFFGCAGHRPPRKGAAVISSPCKGCRKRDLPKDECIKTCQLIQNIQHMQLSRNESDVATAVDFSEATLFQMMFPSASALNLC